MYACLCSLSCDQSTLDIDPRQRRRVQHGMRTLPNYSNYRATLSHVKAMTCRSSEERAISLTSTVSRSRGWVIICMVGLVIRLNCRGRLGLRTGQGTRGTRNGLCRTSAAQIYAFYLPFVFPQFGASGQDFSPCCSHSRSPWIGPPRAEKATTAGHGRQACKVHQTP